MAANLLQNTATFTVKRSMSMAFRDSSQLESPAPLPRHSWDAIVYASFGKHLFWSAFSDSKVGIYPRKLLPPFSYPLSPVQLSEYGYFKNSNQERNAGTSSPNDGTQYYCNSPPPSIS